MNRALLLISVVLLCSNLSLLAQPPVPHAPGGLKLVQSIALNRHNNRTLSFHLDMVPDGALLYLAKSGTGKWSLEQITGWQGASPSIRILHLSLGEAVSGVRSHANLGSSPSGRYLLVSSSNEQEKQVRAIRARAMAPRSVAMLTVIDLQSSAVVGTHRFVPPDDFDNYGFFNDTLITLARVPGQPLNDSVNEYRAWSLPKLELLATCRHSAYLDDPSHPEPNPHGCDDLLTAIGARSVTKMVHRISGSPANSAPADSHLGVRITSAGLDSRILSPDKKLIMQRSGFAGSSDPITMMNAETGQMVGLVELPAAPAQKLANGSLSWRSTWAMLASGTDGRNYVLVLMPNNHVNVYQCPDR